MSEETPEKEVDKNSRGSQVADHFAEKQARKLGLTLKIVSKEKPKDK